MSLSVGLRGDERSGVGSWGRGMAGAGTCCAGGIYAEVDRVILLKRVEDDFLCANSLSSFSLVTQLGLLLIPFTPGSIALLASMTEDLDLAEGYEGGGSGSASSVVTGPCREALEGRLCSISSTISRAPSVPERDVTVAPRALLATSVYLPLSLRALAGDHVYV